MIKYFCDQCGKEMDKEEHKKHKITFFEYVNKNKRIHTQPSYVTLLSIYPCDECLKKIKKQFNIKSGANNDKA